MTQNGMLWKDVSITGVGCYLDRYMARIGEQTIIMVRDGRSKNSPWYYQRGWGETSGPLKSRNLPDAKLEALSLVRDRLRESVSLLDSAINQSEACGI